MLKHSKRLNEVTILKKVITAITSTIQLRELLDKIAHLLAEITGADSSLIYIKEKKELVLWGSKNPHPRLLGQIKLRLGEGITGWVAEKKKMVAIFRNASEDSRFKLFHNLPEDRYEAFFSLPILVKNELIGVINVQHKGEHIHSKKEITLLKTIAHLVGGAIENARLYEELKKRTAQLEARKYIERAKGILMKKQNLTEEEAFQLIRKESMNKRKSMREIAEAIILAEEMTPK